MAEFRYVLRQFLSFSEGAAETMGITAKQHQAMLAIESLNENACLSIGSLAQRLLVRPHTAVGLADRLVAARLAMRLPRRAGTRGVDLCLTKKGRTILKKLSAIHRKELRALAPSLIRALQHIVRDKHGSRRRP